MRDAANVWDGCDRCEGGSCTTAVHGSLWTTTSAQADRCGHNAAAHCVHVRGLEGMATGCEIGVVGATCTAMAWSSHEPSLCGLWRGGGVARRCVGQRRHCMRRGMGLAVRPGSSAAVGYLIAGQVGVIATVSSAVARGFEFRCFLLPKIRISIQIPRLIVFGWH